MVCTAYSYIEPSPPGFSAEQAAEARDALTVVVGWLLIGLFFLIYIFVFGLYTNPFWFFIILIFVIVALARSYRLDAARVGPIELTPTTFRRSFRTISEATEGFEVKPVPLDLLTIVSCSPLPPEWTPGDRFYVSVRFCGPDDIKFQMIEVFPREGPLFMLLSNMDEMGLLSKSPEAAQVFGKWSAGLETHPTLMQWHRRFLNREFQARRD